MTVVCAVPLPPYPAGSAIVCAALLRALAARGHRIHAIAPASPETVRAAAAFDRQHVELGVTRFMVPYFERYAFTARDAATNAYRTLERAGIHGNLRRLLATENPDVVLIGREIYGPDAAEICRTEGVPALLISHGGPSTAIAHGAWPAARAEWLLAGLRAVDLVVSVARHWAAVLRRLGVPRVITIPNPVDLARFTPSPKDPVLSHALRLAPGDLVVLHASNFSAVKRVLDVIEAARVAILRDPRLVFVMLGDGPERARAQAACARWGLRRRFRFPGWIHHDEMPRYFRLADCVVVASEHETQSLVYLEAQASGKCLMASHVPGAREVITNGRTGFLFNPGDVTGLAALLVATAADPDRRAAVGRAGRARVTAHALPRVTDAYEKALRGLVDAKASGRRATVRPPEEPPAGRRARVGVPARAR